MSVGISIVYNYVTVKHTKLFFFLKTNNNMYFIMHLLALFAATGSKNYQDVRNIIMVGFKLLHKTKLSDYKWNITSHGEISIVFHFQH